MDIWGNESRDIFIFRIEKRFIVERKTKNIIQ